MLKMYIICLETRLGISDDSYRWIRSIGYTTTTVLMKIKSAIKSTIYLKKGRMAQFKPNSCHIHYSNNEVILM